MAAARVSLAELASAGVLLHSTEATAIVVDLCRQYERGEIRGIPSTHVIRLTPEGAVVAEGPITTDQPPVQRAAQLLNDLLPPFGAGTAYHVPGALRIIVTRALGALDLPPFRSLTDFCTTVERFAADDLASTARNLYRTWEISKTPRTLTVSDLRRARRATGMSLEQIASACGVSAVLLRELEWGYLKNWRNDAVGRTWLTGYAKASGLDEALVTSIVVPMLEEADPRPSDGSRDERVAQEVALVASSPKALLPAPRPEPRRPGRLRLVWAAASAASIALIAVLGMLAWPRPSVQARIEPTAPAFIPPPVSEPIARPAADAVSAVRHPTEHPRLTKAHTTVKRVGTPPHKPSSKLNFFKRQLLRIVIK